MGEAILSAKVIDLAAYRAARAARRFHATPTSYRLWDPSAGDLSHDTIVVPVWY